MYDEAEIVLTLISRFAMEIAELKIENRRLRNDIGKVNKEVELRCAYLQNKYGDMGDEALIEWKQ